MNLLTSPLFFFRQSERKKRKDKEEGKKEKREKKRRKKKRRKEGRKKKMADFSEKIQKLDFYPKIAEEHRVRTLTGALLSLLTLVFVLFLFHQEMKDYLAVGVNPELMVDTSFGELLRINLDIYFPELACDFVTIDVLDVTGASQVDITHNVIKQRYTKQGEIIKDDDDDGTKNVQEGLKLVVPETSPGCGSCYGAERDENHCCRTCDDIRNAYAEKGWGLKDFSNIAQCVNEGFLERVENMKEEGCAFKGHLLVKKVRGHFHFSPGKSTTIEHVHVHDFQAGLNDHFNMSHVINHLSFGADFPGHFNPLDGVSKMSGDEYSTSFSYFTKIVPTTYSSLHAEAIQSSQYSVTEHSRSIPKPSQKESHHSHLLPGVFVHYDLSPIKVTFTEHQASLGQFLTNLCSIVGGLFTIAGVIDLLVYKGLTKIKA